MKNLRKPMCKARGVSLPEDVDQKVNERLAKLRPQVKGFSHYIQLLVDADLKEKAPFGGPNAQSVRELIAA